MLLLPIHELRSHLERIMMSLHLNHFRFEGIERLLEIVGIPLYQAISLASFVSGGIYTYSSGTSYKHRLRIIGRSYTDQLCPIKGWINGSSTYTSNNRMGEDWVISALSSIDGV